MKKRKIYSKEFKLEAVNRVIPWQLEQYPKDNQITKVVMISSRLESRISINCYRHIIVAVRCLSPSITTGPKCFLIQFSKVNFCRPSF